MSFVVPCQSIPSNETAWDLTYSGFWEPEAGELVSMWLKSVTNDAHSSFKWWYILLIVLVVVVVLAFAAFLCRRKKHQAELNQVQETRNSANAATNFNYASLADTGKASHPDHATADGSSTSSTLTSHLVSCLHENPALVRCQISMEELKFIRAVVNLEKFGWANDVTFQWR